MYITGPLFDENINYTEIYILNEVQNFPFTKFDVNLSEDKFRRIFKNIKRHKQRSFKKIHTQTLNATLEHVSDLENEYVNELVVNDCSLFTANRNDFLKVDYSKTSKSVFSFPSNTNIYDIVYHQRLIFKLDNCLYLNFQLSENYEGQRHKQIFFNVNQGKTFDDQAICKLINETLKLF